MAFLITDREEYKFCLEKVEKPQIITIEGVKKKVLTVKMEVAKFIESDDDSEGVPFVDYTDMFVIEYNGGTHWGFNSVSNSLQRDALKFGYGDTFEIWIGTYYADCYDPWYFKLFAMSKDFAGILRKKSGDEFGEYFTDLRLFTYSPLTDEDGSYIIKNNMYKFEIEVKEDTVLCFDTTGLKPKNYNVNTAHNHICGIDILQGELPNYYHGVEYGTMWKFELTNKLVNQYGEFHPHMVSFYKDMCKDIKVYINGEEIIAQDGVYTVADNRPPASFNEGNHDYTTSYEITFSGLNLEGIIVGDIHENLKQLKINSNIGINKVDYKNMRDGIEYISYFFYDVITQICYYDVNNLDCRI